MTLYTWWLPEVWTFGLVHVVDARKLEHVRPSSPKPQTEGAGPAMLGASGGTRSQFMYCLII